MKKRFWILYAVLTAISVATARSEAAKGAPGTPAPTFTLPDTNGKKHALNDYRGRPVALFVYCGCGLCHEAALEWNKMQRSGVLAQTPGKAPKTVILYHGNTDQAKIFALDTMLDLKQIDLLTDTDEKISREYGAEVCPRVFVLNPQGKIHYTNNEKGADSYKIPAQTIVMRTVAALRTASRTATKSPPAATKRAVNAVKSKAHSR